MYGQTGSGKTFTMLGSLSDQNSNNIKTPNSKFYDNWKILLDIKNIENPPIQGIILYAVKGIFEKIKQVIINKFQFLLIFQYFLKKNKKIEM